MPTAVRYKLGTYAVSLATAWSEDESGEPARQWVHLLPSGSFTARDGRGPWLLDDPASVVQATARYAGGADLAIDYEHQIDLSPKNGQPAPAAGWIKGLDARADGLWGLVEWTAKAREMIRAKEYRYLSPVFLFGRDGVVTQLLRAALTNNPALELTALARSEPGPGQADDLVELRTLLDAPADADLGALTERVRELLTERATAQPDPARFVPIDAFQATATELHAVQARTDEQLRAERIDRAIEGGHLLPQWRDWTLALCRSNPEAFEEFMAKVSPTLAFLRGTQTGGLPPEQRGARRDALLNDEQSAICRALGHTPEDLITYGKR